MALIPAMVADAGAKSVLHDDADDARIMFAQLEFTDMWEDAGMPELIVWLRGSTNLRIPQAWRPYLPVKLEASNHDRPV